MEKTILVTNGRFPITLDLIRNFSNAGNRVLVAETSRIHYCSASNAVAKNFLIPSPRKNPEEYIDTILNIIEEEKVDLFLPGWEDVLVTSKYLEKFPKNVAFTSLFELTHALHHKWKFYNLLKKLGFNSPETCIVKTKKDIDNFSHNSFYLKTCYSRAAMGTKYISDKNKLKNLNIGNSNPYIIQEKIDGKQFCTYSICHEGKIKAHATYPTHYASLNSKKNRGNYCLSYEEVSHPSIFSFVEEFAKQTNYTGSLAFDIFEKNGVIIPLECNPRFTSGIALLTDHKNLSDAYFNCCENLLLPPKGTKKQLFVQSILFASKHAIVSRSVKPFFKTLFQYNDITFHKKDKKPFFFQPVLAIHYFLQSIKYKKNMISSYSHDLDFEG